MASARKHVLFVTFTNVSHINCLLQLARKVAKYHDVTFIASAVRVEQLRQRGTFTAEDEKSIRFVGLLDSITMEEVNDSSFGGMKSIMDKYQDALLKMMVSFPASAGPLGTVMQHQPMDPQIIQPVDVYIVDLVASFNVGPVLDRGVPVIVFATSAGFVFSNKILTDDKTPVLPDDAYFSDWEAHDDVSRTGMPGKFKESCLNAFGENGLYKRLHGVILNSIAEVEPEALKTLQSNKIYANMPLRFVAPLFDSRNEKLDPTEATVMDWLDKQEKRSVVYASFGTMAVSKKEQIEQIAKALLAVGRPFIWGLRQEEHQFLPAEMLEKDQENPKFLLLPWTPQRAILNHQATAVFLSHAGWNSYLESMDAGVPMVAWPLFGDHFGIANMLVKAGAGVKIPGTSMLFQNVIPAETVVETILTVGAWKNDGLVDMLDSDRYAKNAREVGQLIKNATQPGGSSYQAFMDLVTIDIGQSGDRQQKV